MSLKRATGHPGARRLLIPILLSVATVVAACGGTSNSTTSSSGGTLARIKSQGLVRTAFANENPTAFADSNGNLTGWAVDEVKAFFKSIGVTNVEGVLTGFDSMVPGLLANRFDVVAAGFDIQPARCAQVGFGEPDVFIPEAMMVRTGNPLNVHTYKDAATNPQAIVGGVSGSGATMLMQIAGVPSDRLIQFPDEESAVTALLGGRVNVIGDTETSIAIDVSQSSGLEEVRLSSQPLAANGQTAIQYEGVAFRKADTDLRNAYNSWLAQAKASGEEASIIAKYGLGPEAIAPPTATTAQLCKG